MLPFPSPGGLGSMPTFIFLGLLLMSTIGAVVAWHARVVGQPLTLPQLGIASFGVLNILICLWELCLFYRHDRVRRNGAALVAHFGERRWPALGRLLWAPIGWRNVLHPDMWADVWAHYSVFDPAYMDSISFGYTIDIGNGFTSIAPTLLWTLGMTPEAARALGMPPRLLAVVSLLGFYQIAYGTAMYFVSWAHGARRTAWASRKALWDTVAFVVLVNGVWFVVPLCAMYSQFCMVMGTAGLKLQEVGAVQG